MDAPLHGHVLGRTTQDWNLIRDRDVLPPGAVPEVHSRMRFGVLLLHIEEGLLVLGVGEAP